jgi:hypothetical protein
VDTFEINDEKKLTDTVLIATPIASGFTKSWEGLAAARLVLGIGMGAKGKYIRKARWTSLTC